MTTSELQSARSETLMRIERIVRDILDDEQVILADDMQARDVPGWDSLAHVNIMFAVEEAFGVQLREDALFGIETVGDLVIAVEAARRAG